MKSDLKINKIIDMKLIAILILSFIGITIINTSILFLFGATINQSLLIFDLLFSIIIVYLIFGKQYNKKNFFINAALMIFLFFILTYFSMIFYDVSWDGNTYHKQLIGLLKNGLNPVYNNGIGDIWTQHYANASEIWSAVLYSFFGNIESGKVLHLLLAFCLCVFVYKFLTEKKIKRCTAILFSVALSFNPLLFNQFHSYYIDSIVASSLYLVIFALLKMIDERGNRKNKDTYFILILSIIICCNTKFTALLICGMFSVLFGGYVIIYEILKKNYKIAKKLIILFVSIFAFSILIVGSSSYVKNYFKYGHPFYPLKGEGAIDIESNNEPILFKNYNHFEKFLYATFSKTNTWYDEAPKLKIPFTVWKSEMNSIRYPDIRIGGLGVWYSGLLVLSLPIIIYGFYTLIKKKSKWSIVMGLACFGIIAPIPFLPIVWQARYYPQIYLIPFIAMLYLMFSKTKINKIIVNILIILAIGNSAFLLPQVGERLQYSIIINNELVKLSELSLTNKVYISKNNAAFYGAYYNYLDKGIKYEYVNKKIKNGVPIYPGALYKVEKD